MYSDTDGIIEVAGGGGTDSLIIGADTWYPFDLLKMSSVVVQGSSIDTSGVTVTASSISLTRSSMSNDVAYIMFYESVIGNDTQPILNPETGASITGSLAYGSTFSSTFDASGGYYISPFYVDASVDITDALDITGTLIEDGIDVSQVNGIGGTGVISSGQAPSIDGGLYGLGYAVQLVDSGDTLTITIGKGRVK